MSANTLSYPLTDREKLSRTAKKRAGALASSQIRNTWQTVSLFAAAAGLVFTAVAGRRTAATLEDIRDHPVIIRVDKEGQVDVVSTRPQDFQPNNIDLQTWLGEFVQKRMRRVRSILYDPVIGYGASLLLTEEKLARSIERKDQETHWMEDFMAGRTSPTVLTREENDVKIDSVLIHSLIKRPNLPVTGTATVRYHLTYYTADHEPTDQEAYVEDISFTFATKIKPSMYMTNPIGLVVTYFNATKELN